MEIPPTLEELAVKARPQAILGDFGTTYLLTYNIDKNEMFDKNEFLGKTQDWASAVIALCQPQNPLHGRKVLLRFKLFLNMDDAISGMYAIAGNKPVVLKCDDVGSERTAWQGVVKGTEIVYTDYDTSVEPIYQGAQTS